MKVIFKELTKEDVNFAYKLRMDKLSREMSFNSEIVPFDSFEIGFQCRVEDKDFRLFKACCFYDPEPFGIISLNDNTLSWMVDPERRGQGLGGLMLKQFASFVKKPLQAFIKHENKASQRIAEKAGFILRKEEEDCQTWILC